MYEVRCTLLQFGATEARSGQFHRPNGRTVLLISVHWCLLVVKSEGLSSVDNATLAPTVTASKSCRAPFWFYETHLPAIQANTETSARLSCADADEGRPRDPRTPPATRPKTAAPQRSRETLRSSYPSLIFEIRNYILAPLAQFAEQLTLNQSVAKVSARALADKLPI